VKTSPIRRDVTPNLPTPSRLGILQSEAGNRAQSVEKEAGNNTGANGGMTWANKSYKSVLIQSYNLNKTCRLDSLYSHSIIRVIAVNSEERIGKLDYPKSSK
jgi:hypothetical protein